MSSCGVSYPIHTPQYKHTNTFGTTFSHLEHLTKWPRRRACCWVMEGVDLFILVPHHDTLLCGIAYIYLVYYRNSGFLLAHMARVLVRGVVSNDTVVLGIQSFYIPLCNFSPKPPTKYPALIFVFIYVKSPLCCIETIAF